uniref:Hydrolase n=1 Tax=Thermogemmatispora argillosa TaxID=2045280 RepID=A0A455T2B2_9CHLR|nr:hydrolase [Thermogemmatispora argillosa]
MVGRSHLLIGLTAGVVLDSLVHLSGPPITLAPSVPLKLVVAKAIYYVAVGFGSLLPDIDNAHSTLGRKFGWISREIQRIAGHRTLFHSLLGLLLGSLLALGAQQLVLSLLAMRGLSAPASLMSATHMIFFAVLFGCIVHILCDALTEGGVPLLWPNPKRFGFPPNPDWRFRTGTWPEHVIVWSFIILVGIGIWQNVIYI